MVYINAHIVAIVHFYQLATLIASLSRVQGINPPFPLSTLQKQFETVKIQSGPSFFYVVNFLRDKRIKNVSVSQRSWAAGLESQDQQGSPFQIGHTWGISSKIMAIIQQRILIW